MINFADAPDVVAPQLLGCVLTIGEVSLRITEVEAYLGANDEASHAYRGKTARNAAMFGPPGCLYVYNSYGIHKAGNIVCWPDGTAGGVLLRAGAIVTGTDVAQARRGDVHPHSQLAQGPGNLGKALGLLIEHNHSPISQDPTDAEAGFLLVSPDEPVDYMTGPRIGISKNTEPHWRFWIPGDPTVSKKRR